MFIGVEGFELEQMRRNKPCGIADGQTQEHQRRRLVVQRQAAALTAVADIRPKPAIVEQPAIKARRIAPPAAAKRGAAAAASPTTPTTGPPKPSTPNTSSTCF